MYRTLLCEQVEVVVATITNEQITLDKVLLLVQVDTSNIQCTNYQGTAATTTCTEVQPNAV